MPKFYSHGKLLLTSEYAVLDGALALAIPTKTGQSLKVRNTETNILCWKSFDHNNNIWFKGEFNVTNSGTSVLSANDLEVVERLNSILEAANKLSNSTLELKGLEVETHLEFDRQWGLGTSSTLINNVANWLHVDPYALLKATFGGSGYDIACAQHDTPVLYQLSADGPKVQAVELKWPFVEQLNFVYLNQKQNSRSGIAQYKERNRITKDDVANLNIVTEQIVNSTTFDEFVSLIDTHNDIIGRLIGQEPVSGQFNDFPGTLKNLGAWGGDFILACSPEDPTSYFKDKGYGTVIPFNEMFL